MRTIQAVLAGEASKRALIRLYLTIEENASEVTIEDECQVCAESQGGSKLRGNPLRPLYVSHFRLRCGVAIYAFS